MNSSVCKRRVESSARTVFPSRALCAAALAVALGAAARARPDEDATVPPSHAEAAPPSRRPASPDDGATAPPRNAAENASAPSYEEEVVVRAPTRLEVSTRERDATVQVVGAEELQASGARTLQEALQRLPGVHVADEQGNRLQQDLTVRGLTASPVTGLPQGLSVFVDGVRVNEPTAEEVNFDLVPLSDVERIEIVRGPHAVFGRNTLAGAIQIVTRRGGARPAVEVEAEGGSTASQELRGRVAGPLGPLDGYLSLGEMTDRGWRTRAHSRSFQLFGKLGVRREDTDATLSYQLQRDRLEEPGSLPRSLLDQDRTQNYTPGDVFEPELHLLTFNARQRLGSGISLASNAFFRALDAEQFNASFISANTRLFDRARTVGGAVELDHRAALGAARNRAAVGAEVSRSSVHLAVHQEPNSGTTTSEEGLPLPRLTSDLSDTHVAVGVFAQDDVQLVDGPLAGLGATAAVRFDRIKYTVLDTSPDDPGKATGDAAFSAVVPSVGVSWAFSPRWVASASYTEGFRAPAFLELTCADPAAPCVGLQAGVAPDTSLGSLRAVRSRTVDLGVRGSLTDAVTVTADVFRIGLRDDIYAVTAPGNTKVFFQNVGDTRRQGVELGVQARHRAGELALSYAYVLATFESPLSLATPRTSAGVEAVPRGAELPMNPRHRLSVDARVHPLRWLTVSAGATYVGSQYFLGDEANVAPKLAPYAVVRAGVEARWRAWTAFARATNLFDTRYETFGTFAPNGKVEGAPIEPFLSPGPPLRVAGGLRWELE